MRNQRMLAILIMGLVLCLCLAGCRTADQVNPTDAAANASAAVPTADPTAAPTATADAFQSDQPFLVEDFNGVIGVQITPSDADAFFGQPVAMWGMIRPADGETLLWIEYADAYLELSGISEELALTGGDIGEALTDEDRVMELNVEQLIVKGDIVEFPGVAGIAVGSSRDDVLRAFLNLSDQYQGEDAGTLYTISDINPQWQPDWTDSFVGGRVLDGADAALWVYNGSDYQQLAVDCDEVIAYTYVDDFEDSPLTGPGQWNTYGSVEFFLKDGTVTAINLYHFTDPE